MNKIFVTLLATPDFLPGVIVLNYSLLKHNPDSKLLVLITRQIDNNIIDILRINSIKIKFVEEIPNPHLKNIDHRGFIHTFTKLRIFEIIEYKKIVYIDSDMLVCSNIESLFESPHMSAVIAGGLANGNDCWNRLNSGLMVIEPNLALFKKLISKVTDLDSDDKGDQGFIHSFFENWPLKQELHLHHKYNIPITYLDEYCEYYDFDFFYNYGEDKFLAKNISILHFWGPVKPWHISNIEYRNESGLNLYNQAINLWLYYRKKCKI